jgi:hypothetical protein
VGEDEALGVGIRNVVAANLCGVILECHLVLDLDDLGCPRLLLQIVWCNHGRLEILS